MIRSLGTDPELRFRHLVLRALAWLVYNAIYDDPKTFDSEWLTNAQRLLDHLMSERQTLGRSVEGD